MAVRILQTPIAAIAFLTLACGCGPIALADPSPAPSPAHAGSNAADYYKQAIALYDQLSPEDQAIIFKRQQPTADQAAALHAKTQPIAALIRGAKKADYLDFRPLVTNPADPNAISVVTQKVQHLAQTNYWEASYSFASDPADAVADVAA